MARKTILSILLYTKYTVRGVSYLITRVIYAIRTYGKTLSGVEGLKACLRREQGPKKSNPITACIRHTKQPGGLLVGVCVRRATRAQAELITRAIFAYDTAAQSQSLRIMLVDV